MTDRLVKVKVEGIRSRSMNGDTTNMYTHAHRHTHKHTQLTVWFRAWRVTVDRFGGERRLTHLYGKEEKERER